MPKQITVKRFLIAIAMTDVSRGVTERSEGTHGMTALHTWSRGSGETARMPIINREAVSNRAAMIEVSRG